MALMPFLSDTIKNVFFCLIIHGDICPLHLCCNEDGVWLGWRNGWIRERTLFPNPKIYNTLENHGHV